MPDEVKKHLSVADGTISLTGGAKKWICIPYKKPITGSATKLRAHLLGTPGLGVAACPDISEDAKNAIRAAEQENSSNKRKEPAPSLVSLPVAPTPVVASQALQRFSSDLTRLKWIKLWLDGSMSMESPSTL